MTLHEAIIHGERLLSTASIPNPRWNAERLLMTALHQDRTYIYANPSTELSNDQRHEYDRLIARRMEYYPLAYIENTQEFYGRPFFIDENVLIPRSETELIIDASLQLQLPPQPRILDAGAGSGVLALTLALEIPDSQVVALELSKPALQVLQRNSQSRVNIVQADMFRMPFVTESFDLVVSNPPYVEERHELPPETKWEPYVALHTPSLEKTYAGLLEQSARVLKPGGYLVFEIGFNQHDRIRSVCSDFKVLRVLNDAAGIPRTFVLQKQHMLPPTS